MRLFLDKYMVLYLKKNGLHDVFLLRSIENRGGDWTLSKPLPVSFIIKAKL